MAHTPGQALARHFSPVVVVEDARVVSPARAEDVLPHAQLLELGREVVLDKGRVTPSLLAASGRRYLQEKLRLRVLQEDLREFPVDGDAPVHAASERVLDRTGHLVGYEITYLFLYVFEKPQKLFGLWEEGTKGVEWVHLTMRVSAGGVLEGVCYNRLCESKDWEWLPPNQVPKVDGKILVFLPKDMGLGSRSSPGQGVLSLLKECGNNGRVWTPSIRVDLDESGGISSCEGGLEGRGMQHAQFRGGRSSSMPQDKMNCAFCVNHHNAQTNYSWRKLGWLPSVDFFKFAWSACFRPACERRIPCDKSFWEE